ncbi:MAG: CoA ester lyase [Aquisalimonadaceae bacterium]
MTGKLAHSYLFVPGNRPERFAKAWAAGADAVIVDLEDAVPIEDKVRAREHVAEWLSPERPVLVRINAADTEWFQEDAALCRMPGVAGVVLPKAEHVEDIRHFAAQCPIYPLIETANGLWHAEALARQPEVARLVFGSIDFQLDLGISGDDDELLYFRSQLVLISRIAGLPAPVDGVSVALDDAGQLRADVQRSRRLGFGAKLCIHPKQVEHVNAGFRPGAEDIAWAMKVVDAATAARGAAVAVDGRMIDRPLIERARQILADAERHT